MTSLAERLAKASKAGELQTLSEPAQDDPMVPLLRKMRAYLADPAHWVKGRMFGSTNQQDIETRDQLNRGYLVSADCPVCVLGAAFLATGAPLTARQEQKLSTALGFPYISALTRWNDDDLTTHAEVLACLDQAIDRLSVAR